MSRARSFSTPALVLKHTKTGEADKVVTLFTQPQGKITAIAKGVRKLKSSKRAFLEPGNLIKAFFVTTKSMPLLTQASLIENTGSNFEMKRIRQLTHFLEIVNSLFVEEEIEPDIFELVLETRGLVLAPENRNAVVRKNLDLLLQYLGYQDLKTSGFATISDHIASLVDKPLKSWDFLTIKK